MTGKPLMPIVWALHQAEHRGYSPTNSLILITLANHVHGPEGAWPSVPTLARKCRCGERHARRALRMFEADGLITTERGNGRNNASRYRLLVSTVNGVSQPDLFGEPPKKVKVPKPPHRPSRKGGSEAPLSREKGDSRPPFPEQKGGLSVQKKGGLESGESTKKNPLEERKTALRAETAVAVSHFTPSEPPEFDPRKVLWTRGVEILRGLTGQTTSAAKRQTGQFLKLANQDAVSVLRALEVAAYEKPYEPIPWITAAIKARAAKRSSPVDELRERWNLPTFVTPGGGA